MVTPDIRQTLQLNPVRTGQEIATALREAIIFRELNGGISCRLQRQVGTIEVNEVRFAQNQPNSDVVIYATVEDQRPELQTDKRYGSIVLGNAEPIGATHGCMVSDEYITDCITRVKDSLDKRLNTR